MTVWGARVRVEEGVMNRRGFLAGSAAVAVTGQLGPQRDIVLERSVSGQPHRGKVLALVTPHLDDGPIFAGGTLAKLLREGYGGYFIRTSNDEKDSYKLTLGETMLANEQDTTRFVQATGLKRAFDLSYRNHRMDEVARTELRGRLIDQSRALHPMDTNCPWLWPFNQTSRLGGVVVAPCDHIEDAALIADDR
jgi:hypothetical protein